MKLFFNMGYILTETVYQNAFNTLDQGEKTTSKQLIAIGMVDAYDSEPGTLEDEFKLYSSFYDIADELIILRRL